MDSEDGKRRDLPLAAQEVVTTLGKSNSADR
jgi:hypothetical protein